MPDWRLGLLLGSQRLEQRREKQTQLRTIFQGFFQPLQFIVLDRSMNSGGNIGIRRFLPGQTMVGVKGTGRFMR